MHCPQPENMLMGLDGYVRVTDFGFAKEIGRFGYTYTMCGTPDYLAPEVIRSQVWTMTCILPQLGVHNVVYDSHNIDASAVCENNHRAMKSLLPHNRPLTTLTTLTTNAQSSFNHFNHQQEKHSILCL